MRGTVSVLSELLSVQPVMQERLQIATRHSVVGCGGYLNLVGICYIETLCTSKKCIVHLLSPKSINGLLLIYNY